MMCVCPNLDCGEILDTKSVLSRATEKAQIFRCGNCGIAFYILSDKPENEDLIATTIGIGCPNAKGK